jgi:hypothetical protein
VGWANVVKAVIYFAFPAFALRKLRIISHDRANLVVAGGVFFLLLAGLLGYHVWATR